MEAVLENYFDESTRQLRSGAPQKNDVKLPPIHAGPTASASSSSLPPGMMTEASFNLATQPSAKPPREHVMRSLIEERYEEVLKENEKLNRKIRGLHDQLSIVQAKKDAYKGQSEKSDREVEQVQKAFDAVQRDAQRIQSENEYWASASREAVEMMNEMRQNHITEVRLLQRGLQNRQGEDSKNRVNEMADLLDRLGKCIVQRDEVLKEKTRLKAQLHQSRQEVKTLQDERRKFQASTKKYQIQLSELSKANSILMGETGGGGKGEEDDLSDDEFEEELCNFERRYQVLDEGAKGLDHWVESLHRERGLLEKSKTEQQDLIGSLERNVKSYHSLCDQKDLKYADMESRYAKVQSEYARLQTQVAQRQQDIEYRIEAERRNFEVRIKKMQTEFEHASSTAMGYQTLNEKLQNELMKVHDAYTALEVGAQMADPEEEAERRRIEQNAMDPNKPRVIFPQERSDKYDILSQVAMDPQTLQLFVRDVIADVVNRMADKAGFGHLSVDQQFMSASLTNFKDVIGGGLGWNGEPNMLAAQASFTRTGELLNMEVWLVGPEQMEVRGHEVSSNERFTLDLPEELLTELDQEDPWTELFQMVGMVAGPPRKMVFPTLLGRKEVTIAPSNMEVILTIYMYDPRRYYLQVYHVTTQRMADLILNEDNVTDDMAQGLAPLLKKPEFLYELIRKCLLLVDKENEAGPLEPAVLDLRCEYDPNKSVVPGEEK
ncbi:unnamed protein product [Amoebophrya sp. A25]|nr:unnamed protein product [Amoebophrya sp. A25]|eukprot:GSA25T00012183001.1